MNETQPATEQQKTNGPKVARAEERLNEVGRRIGQLAAITTMRVRGVASTIGKRVEETRPGPSEQERQGVGQTTPGETPQRQVVQEAEERVNRFGQQVNQFAALATFQVRRAGARIREEAEDILAEAQAIRHERGSRRE